MSISCLSALSHDNMRIHTWTFALPPNHMPCDTSNKTLRFMTGDFVSFLSDSFYPFLLPFPHRYQFARKNGYVSSLTEQLVHATANLLLLLLLLTAG